MLKLGLFAFYMSVRVRSMLGYKVDKDELKDFELDYTAEDNASKGSADAKSVNTSISFAQENNTLSPFA